MRKVGFFFQNSIDIKLLFEIAKNNNLELVGVFFKNHCESTNSYIYKSEDELLVQIEVAFNFFDSLNYFEFTNRALRRGVNVFLACLPDYSYSNLLEINELSLEIGVPVGFGCSGEYIIRQDEIINNYFLLQLNRDAGINVNDVVFKRMLINDIASFVRVMPSGFKKLRVNGFPLFTKSVKAINLRLEYDSGCVITYGISRIIEPQNCVLRFFSGENGYFKELPFERGAYYQDTINYAETLLNDKWFVSCIETYIQEISGKSSLSFGIEKAIETLRIFETIEDRLTSIN